VLWWIEWYGNVMPTTEWLLYNGPLVATGTTAAFGLAVCVGSLLGPRRPGYAGVVARGFLLLLLLASAAPLVVSAVHASRVWRTPGIPEFRETCHRCHVRSQALYFVKTPAEWERTLERMADYEYPPLYEDEVDAIEQITDEEEAVVLEFMVAMRSFPDAWTYRTRCQRCHGAPYGVSPSWTPRRPEDWERIVGRHERWSPYYHRKDVRDQVVGHLVEHHADDTTTLGLDAGIYERAHELDRTCSACHALSRGDVRYRAAAPEVRREVVERMVFKMNEPLTEAEVQELSEQWAEVIADPEVFDLLFPHDRPVREGGLPW